VRATYVVTTEPTTEPLTLDEFKDALRETTTDFNSELARILTATRRQVEHDSERRLITQTIKMYLDDFPSTHIMEIRTAPVASITSVKYLDTDGNEQTLSSSTYTEDLTSTPPRIILQDGNSWPATEGGVPNTVYVEFVAGYGGASAVPAEALVAITELGRHMWHQCEDDAHLGTYRNLIAKLRWTEVPLA